jgi:hypothetical protein
VSARAKFAGFDPDDYPESEWRSMIDYLKSVCEAIPRTRRARR